MKKFTFKGVLDGFRSSVTSQQGSAAGVPNAGRAPEAEIVEVLKPENFTVTKTFCHGFPYQPTALAYDPMQKLLGIGTKHGCLRILGRPGVDIHARHDPEQGAVLQMRFLLNEGGLITSTADDSLHLWDFRSGKKPSIVHSLKFQRERVTCLHLPLQCKWLHVGTERGNVHVVNIDTFELSGYIVNWNKAIELSRKTHPGAIIAMEDNPLDPNKLLIGFDSGALVLWDLKAKVAEARFQAAEGLTSICWHSDGKQFMCSHSDGSLSTWALRNPRPVSVVWPHSRNSKDGRPEPCNGIQKAQWKSSRTGDNFVIFSGGLTVDRTTTAGKTPSLSVIHGKTTTVLEMEHPVLDFVVLCEALWESEVQDPVAIIVLLQQDLVLIDLLTPGYPCFENPYPMDIHESPVTSCVYVADCPGDLIPAFYSVGSKAAVKKTGFSEREWPVDGGQWGSTSCSYAEIIITGHADGSLKFWDASSTTLQSLYKLKTSKPFERMKRRKSNESPDDDPFAVQQIVLCPESRYLAIAGASSQVILYKFRKHEHTSEIPVLEIPILYEAECEFSFEKPEFFCNVRVKSGMHKKAAGYQVELVCLTPWVNGEPPGAIMSVAVSSQYGLMAYGNESGLVIVDIIQKVSVLSSGTPDLYGVADPYSRAPRSPSTTKKEEEKPDKSPTTESQQMTAAAAAAAASPAVDSKKPPPAMDPVRRTKSQGSAKRSLTKCYSIAPQQTSGGGSEEFGGVHAAPIPKSHLLLMSSRQYRSIGGGGSSVTTAFLGGGGDSVDSDKLDSGFTRSRSSSMSSLDNITSEAVQSLVFIGCMSRRSEYTPSPTLWVGTSLGSVLLIALQLPAGGDARLTDPVTTTPAGSVFRLKGSVLSMSFLDEKCNLLSGGGEQWRDEAKEGGAGSGKGADTPKLSSSSTNQSPVQSIDSSTQYAVLVSEKQARVISLPSQNCVYKQVLCEPAASSFVVKANVTTVKDSTCLVCYLSTGHLQIHSIPSLRLLLDVEFVPLADLSFQQHSGKKGGGLVDPMLSIWGQQLFVNEDATQIAKTFCLSAYGHGIYLSSPSEIQKFTISTDFFQIMDTMLGDLFLEREMPERPKEGFFTGLFGGGPKSFDREELFGETASGKGAKSVAKHIPGTAGEQLQMRAVTSASEIGRAKMLAIERGEKLGQLEDKSAKMAADAENFSSAAHQLMLRYKDKKWYQL